MKIALTGSLAMGKSTIASFFAEFGVPLWSADKAVDALYEGDSGLHELIWNHAPHAISERRVDKALWREYLRENPKVLDELEEYIHKLVRESREEFHRDHPALSLCEIPLLFETGGEGEFDRVIVASAPAKTQRERAMARGSMDAALFETLLSRQMPDLEKRKRADIVLDSSKPLEETRSEVRALVNRWRKGEE